MATELAGFTSHNHCHLGIGREKNFKASQVICLSWKLSLLFRSAGAQAAATCGFQVLVNNLRIDDTID